MGIFEPYRAIGCITTHVPFSVQRLGTRPSSRKSFPNLQSIEQLNDPLPWKFSIEDPQSPKKIRALASFRRAPEIATWSRHTPKVNLLLLFGEHILSVDVDGNMFIWAYKSVEQNVAPIGHVVLGECFTPSCMIHPDTYLNKVFKS